MAEGAKVTRASTEAEALEIAKSMFEDGDVFVLRKPRPLDRGKVLEWRKSIEDEDTDAFAHGWNRCLEYLEIEINSGRLDVEEG